MGPLFQSESIGGLLKRLLRDLSDLLRAELTRARSEALNEAMKASAAGLWLAGAATLILGAFGAFTTFIILMLATAMQAWLAALIVAAAYGVAGAVLAVVAKIHINAVVTSFRQLRQTVKEDVAWIATETRTTR
ncbi:MAG: phage holin family protein [Candidatus Eremiobacteraeota bacterium]|nr:phage holin family protein [Candidatus Eremiobacteraeota bacterium]